MREVVIVQRVITKSVTKCPECPFFNYHPQEASCDALKDAKDCYANIVGHHGIDKRCPFRSK